MREHNAGRDHAGFPKSVCMATVFRRQPPPSCQGASRSGSLAYASRPADRHPYRGACAPHVPRFVPLFQNPATFRPTPLRATPAQPWTFTQCCGCANGCTGNSIGSCLFNPGNVMNHCNRARPASPALQRLRAARRHSCRARKLRLLQDIVQTLRNAGLMDHDPLTPDEEVRRARGAGN